MCVDYCGLNQLTIKNQYLLPLISKLLDQLNHVKVYTKFDLHGAQNLVCIRKSDEWKTTFKIHYGHFENILMSFGFINVHVVFQHLMNNVFHKYLDNFVVCYIENIFIFSNNMEDQKCHVHLILEKLQEVKLYTKLKKCEFHQFDVELLGYNISGDGICMDPHSTNKNLVICNQSLCNYVPLSVICNYIGYVCN